MDSVKKLCGLADGRCLVHCNEIKLFRLISVSNSILGSDVCENLITRL